MTQPDASQYPRDDAGKNNNHDQFQVMDNHFPVSISKGFQRSDLFALHSDKTTDDHI